jgi:uncharacterized protein involved in type VI secretion and phage assembly
MVCRISARPSARVIRGASASRNRSQAPGHGTFGIPEKDDQVLVAFEHGDPDQPYTVCSLFNPQHRPPHTAN